MIIVLTAVGGGLGALLRFWLDATVTKRWQGSIPLGTIVVNISACLLLGLTTGWVSGHAGWADLGHILGVGILGGYSTFSAASVEGFRLLEARRPVAAFAHAGSMLVLSLTAATLGLWLTA